MIRAEKQCCQRERRFFRLWLPSPLNPDERPRPPVKHTKRFRGKAPVMSRPFPRREKAERQETQERHAGEIIPPAPPLFLPCGCAAAAGQGDREDLAVSVRASFSVSACPHGHADRADACPACAGQAFQRQEYPEPFIVFRVFCFFGHSSPIPCSRKGRVMKRRGRKSTACGSGPCFYLKPFVPSAGEA